MLEKSEGFPLFRLSAESRLLIGRLQKATVGEVITYAEMATLISHPVDGSTGALRTALLRVLRDYDMVFGAVVGVGMKRLNDDEIIDEGTQYANAVRRKAKRSIERVSKVDFTKLPREQQMRHSAHVATMAVVAFVGNDKQIRKIEASITPEKRELPVLETLKMFMK